MKDVRKELAEKITVLTSMQETADPITLLLACPEQPEWNGKINAVGCVCKNKSSWEAYLLYKNQEEPCCFYKKCLDKRCRNQALAKVVVRYGKNVARINRTASDRNSSIFLNLN